MSPEQIRGEEVGPQSDIFSFSAVAFEMFTGSKPFAGDDRLSRMQEVLQSDPKNFADTGVELPQDLQEVLHRGLSKERDGRFPTASELAVQAARVVSGTQGAGNGHALVAEQVSSAAEAQTDEEKGQDNISQALDDTTTTMTASKDTGSKDAQKGESSEKQDSVKAAPPGENVRLDHTIVSSKKVVIDQETGQITFEDIEDSSSAQPSPQPEQTPEGKDQGNDASQSMSDVEPEPKTPSFGVAEPVPDQVHQDQPEQAHSPEEPVELTELAEEESSQSEQEETPEAETAALAEERLQVKAEGDSEKTMTLDQFRAQEAAAASETAGEQAQAPEAEEEAAQVAEVEEEAAQVAEAEEEAAQVAEVEEEAAQVAEVEDKKEEAGEAQEEKKEEKKEEEAADELETTKSGKKLSANTLFAFALPEPVLNKAIEEATTGGKQKSKKQAQGEKPKKEGSGTTRIAIGVVAVLVLVGVVWLFMSPSSAPEEVAEEPSTAPPETGGEGSAPEQGEPAAPAVALPEGPLTAEIVAELTEEQMIAVLSSNDAVGISEVIKRAGEEKNKEVIAKILPLGTHPSYLVRVNVAKVLGDKSVYNAEMMPDVVDALVTMLDDQEYLVRGFSAKALANTGDKTVVPKLQGRLDKEDNEVVQQLLQAALAELG